LNLNFTEKLVENLYESQNSWNLVNEKFEAFKMQYEIMLNKREDGLEVDHGIRPFELDDSLSDDVRALRWPGGIKSARKDINSPLG
jgi:hypothetical protein